MKFASPSLAVAAFFFTAAAQAGPSSSSSSSQALQFDFTGDEGCDSTPTLTTVFAATNKCMPFSTQGRQGAQVMNLLPRNVRLQLFSDSKCTPASEVFSNSTLPPAANECYAEVSVAHSIIVSLA